MKKIVFLVCFVVSGYASMYAGTWVVGANQIRNLLDQIEQGTGDAPPVTPMKADAVTGEQVINTDYENVWDIMEGFTFTPGDVTTTYLNHADEANHWRGFLSIDFAGKGYKQKDGMVISFVQPSLVDWDYTQTPEGYKDLTDYWDRNDLSWLESIDFSGNDFHSIEIDGGMYRVMPLKTINLSNNPNLQSLTIVNCANLELVDVQGTALNETTINWLIEDVHEFSPNATILCSSSAINASEVSVPVVRIRGNNICVENKAPGSKVTVYDLFGRLLLESDEDTLGAASLGSGVYVVKVDDWTTKILKK